MPSTMPSWRRMISGVLRALTEKLAAWASIGDIDVSEETASTSSEIILNSLESAVLVFEKGGILSFANSAAEQLFDTSLNQLKGQGLDKILPLDSPVAALIRQALKTGFNVSEYGIVLESPRISRQVIDIQISTLPEPAGSVSVNIFSRSIADKIDQQITHRNAARSATALAAMLAHEVKIRYLGSAESGATVGTKCGDRRQKAHSANMR